MNLNKLRDIEYVKCIDLLAELIELDRDTKEKIYNYFQSMGIQNFFNSFESVDLSIETCEKLKNIKAITGLLLGAKGGQV